ncbi:MAG: hypothetical protein KDA20_12930, partial [Phycisphaerales bacterium]|nr:hypothetical protein [Phycisphaerales bacterium]
MRVHRFRTLLFFAHASPFVPDAPIQRAKRAFTVLAPGAGRDPKPSDTNTYWAPIAEAWPAWGCEPLGQVRTLPWALAAIGDSLGEAVIAFVNADDDQAIVFKLIDHLWEQAVPLVLVFDELTPARQRLGGRGVMVVPSSAPSAMLASILHTLAERQQMVESL